jgi:hypothetical protein
MTFLMKTRQIISRRTSFAEQRSNTSELRERLARRAHARARELEQRDKLFKSAVPHEKT